MESARSYVYFFMLAGLQIHNRAVLCALVALCKMLNDVDRDGLNSKELVGRMFL